MAAILGTIQDHEIALAAIETRMALKTGLCERRLCESDSAVATHLRLALLELRVGLYACSLVHKMPAHCRFLLVVAEQQEHRATLAMEAVSVRTQNPPVSCG